MEREMLMKALVLRALAYRVELSALCARAGLSRTIAYRWQAGKHTPRLRTIGRLEAALGDIERELAA